MQRAAMSDMTLAERRSRSTRTVRNTLKPLAVDAKDILSGKVPLRSPLERLTSRRYIEQLNTRPTNAEKPSTESLHNAVVPGGILSQVQGQNKPERSREGRPTAHREVVKTTAQSTETGPTRDRCPNKPSNRRRAGDERWMFWTTFALSLG